MNETRIDWPGLNHTWNPITGCLNNCSYCYAARIQRRFKASFEPQFHEKRIKDAGMATEARSIFVGSMTDLFGDFIPKDWTRKVLEACSDSRKHTYWFLTKSPENYFHFLGKLVMIPNIKLGATITGDPTMRGREEQRMATMAELAQRFRGSKGVEIFLSLEPMMGAIKEIPEGINMVIAGAMTGPGAIECKPEWIDAAKNATTAAGASFYLKRSTVAFE